MELKKITKNMCKTCRYSLLRSGDTFICQYILFSGKRRIRDEKGDYCGSYEKKVNKSINKKLNY